MGSIVDTLVMVTPPTRRWGWLWTMVVPSSYDGDVGFPVNKLVVPPFMNSTFEMGMSGLSMIHKWWLCPATPKQKHAGRLTSKSCCFQVKYIIYATDNPPCTWVCVDIYHHFQSCPYCFGTLPFRNCRLLLRWLVNNNSEKPKQPLINQLSLVLLLPHQSTLVDMLATGPYIPMGFTTIFS